MRKFHFMVWRIKLCRQYLPFETTYAIFFIPRSLWYNVNEVAALNVNKEHICIYEFTCKPKLSSE